MAPLRIWILALAAPFVQAWVAAGDATSAAPASAAAAAGLGLAAECPEGSGGCDAGLGLLQLTASKAWSDRSEVHRRHVAAGSANAINASANPVLKGVGVVGVVAVVLGVLGLGALLSGAVVGGPSAAAPAAQVLVAGPEDDVQARWALILAASGVQIVSGSVYAMGAWGVDLRNLLKVSMGDMSTIVAATFLGSLFAMLGGLSFDRLGPRATVALGGALNTAGYTLILTPILLGESVSPTVRLVLAALGAMCAGYSSVSLLDNVVCMACSLSFPRDRAAVVGYLKAVLATAAGLWALLYIHVFQAPHGPGLVAYLTFTALASFAICLLALIPMQVLPEGHRKPIRGRELIRLGMVLAATVALSLFDVGVSFGYSMGLLSETPALGYIGVALAALPLLVLLLPHPPEEDNGAKPEVEAVAQAGTGQAGAAALASDGITFGQAVVGVDFWLLWFIQFVVFGSGVATNQNLAMIFESAGAKSAAGLGVALFALTSSVSRMVVGILSDRYAHVVSRFQWIQVVAVMSMASQALVSTMALGGIMLGILVAGLSFGTFFTVVVPVINEMYGRKQFGVIMGSQLACQAFASISICKVLLPRVYSHAAAGASVCEGTACFRTSFLALAAFNALGVAAALQLERRNRCSMPMDRA